VILFGIESYSDLQGRIATACKAELGAVERKSFPDGERYARVVTEVEDRDVALVGGTPTHDATLELYDLACGLVDNGARSLTLVVPYFGYSTMERPVKPREVVTAKNRARLLSSIPIAAAGNRVLLVDLHSEGLPFYFEGAVRPQHVYAKPVILEAIRALGGPDFVVACTDAGRAKWVESLANDLDVPASFVLKRRNNEGRTEVAAISARVQEKDVVIYDDMIRTGGSLVEAAQAYRQAGARRISAVATHGIFPGDSLDRIRASGAIDRIVCTDTHPRARELEGEFLQVRTLATVLGQHLQHRA
jgi:ribose-phosphate pyrophosphokinase